MTTTTNLDLLGILLEHESFHKRLAAGEFEGTEGAYDDALANEQLLPVIHALGGPEGVAKLLHIVMEMVVEVVGQAHETFDDEAAQTYLTSGILRFMDWVGMALFSGKLVGSGIPEALIEETLRPVPLGELDAQDRDYDLDNPDDEDAEPKDAA